MRICLDYGHGGMDNGASSQKLIEKNINKVIGYSCKEHLKKYGIEVVETRKNDEYVSLADRVKISDNSNSNYFVSIHTNAGGGKGVETYIYKYGGNGEKLAKSVNTELAKYNAMRNPSIKTADFHVLHYTNAPAILIEIGFIDNYTDSLRFDSIEKQQKIGIQIATGILFFLGINKCPVCGK